MAEEKTADPAVRPADFEAIREFINTNDRFGATNGMRLTAVAAGRAEAELEVRPELLNGVGVVQGGAIFTLADLAFAGAANSGNLATVAMTSSINFIRPGAGRRLRAVATEVSRGRQTGVYSIEVFNDAGKLVAHLTTTAFVTGGSLIPARRQDD